MSGARPMTPAQRTFVARARFAFDPAGDDADALASWLGDAPDWLLRGAGAGRRVRAALVADQARRSAHGGLPTPEDDSPAARLVTLGRAGTEVLCGMLALMIAAPRLRHMIRREDVLALGDWPGAAGWDAIRRLAAAPAAEESVWLTGVPAAELATSAQAVALGLLHRLVDARPAAEVARLRLRLPARPTHPLAAHCDVLPLERVEALIEQAGQLLPSGEHAA